MGDDVEARKLGEKLLMDVEVEGLSEILSSLRTLCSEHSEDTSTISSNSVFGISELDVLVSGSSTVVELVSPAPTHHPSGAGKTSLLYLIIAHAILPPTFSSIPDLDGHDAAIVLFDPLRHFSVSRLATVIHNLLVTKLGTPVDTLDNSIKTDLTSLIHRCLNLVHILHPSSWDSLISTLRALPTYLFDSTAHNSTHRRIHSLILEDIDAFTWSLRLSDAQSTPASHSAARSTTNPLAAPSRELTSELLKLRSLLSCNVVLTSPSILPKNFRPALPASWPSGLDVTRLGVRRVEVLKFAPEMGVEQADTEGSQRWDVVKRGRFEAWRVRAGVREGEEGFVFRVGDAGVEIEREAR